MSYFSQMGGVWYTLDDGSKVLLNDVTAFASLTNVWKTDARVSLPYKIRDGELPHMISYKLYGTVDYWWVVLLANNIYDLDNQWPRNLRQLDAYIARKYPGKNRTDVHHYLNPQGLIADILSLKIDLGLTTDAEVIDQAGLEAITIEDFEIAANEMKRNIILIDPDYIQTVQSEFDKAMEG